ncbi:MAG: AI-2E family transporter [Candidatus Dormibacteraceae bacterium]
MRSQIVFGLITVVVLGMVVYLLRNVMGALLLGGLIALMIEPWTALLTRIGLPRPLAILIALTVLLSVVVALILPVLPLFVEEIPLLRDQAPGVVAAAQDQLTHLGGNRLRLLGSKVDFSAMTQLLVNNGSQLLLGQLGTVLGLGLAALGTLAQAGLMILVAFLISLDVNRLKSFILGLSPTSYQMEAEAILGEVIEMLRSYIRAQLIVAGLIGLVSGLTVWVIGLKYPLALGLMAGITALIPYVGPILGALPAELVALSISWRLALLVAITYIVINFVTFNFISPRIFGRAVRLPALVVIVALIAGYSLAGILGILIAVPVAAIARILYDYIHPRLFTNQSRLSI